MIPTLIDLAYKHMSNVHLLRKDLSTIVLINFLKKTLKEGDMKNRLLSTDIDELSHLPKSALTGNFEASTIEAMIEWFSSH
jgi:hypothetical protein